MICPRGGKSCLDGLDTGSIPSGAADCSLCKGTGEVTGNYPRAYWHCHIGNDNIHISWGPVCPGEECDGLNALAVEAVQRALKILESEDGRWL